MVTRTNIDAHTWRSNRTSIMSAKGVPVRSLTKEGAVYKSYHKPMRSRSVAVTHAKRSAFGPRSSSLSPPPNYIQRLTDTDAYAIGIALGSPTHPPDMVMAAGWQPQIKRTVTITGGTGQGNKHGLSRSLSRKLSLFGRTRSKRGREQDSSRRGSQANVSGSSVEGRPSREGSPKGTPTHAVSPRSPHQRKKSKHTPIIIQQLPSPTAREEPAAKPSKEENAPAPPPKDFPSPLIGGTTKASVDKTNGAKATPTQDCLLDVEIPSVKMDRYSVMFGNVLQRRSTPSLLARRQATLEKLNTVREHDVQLSRPRRPSVQSVKGSPSFSLFPQSPGGRGTGAVLSPRSRSNTSPAILPSPLRTPFEAPKTSEKSPQESVSPASETVTNENLRSGSLPEQPRLVSKFHRKKSTSSTAGSPPAAISPSKTKQKLLNSSRMEEHVVFMSPSWKSKSPPLAKSPESTRSPKSPQNGIDSQPLTDAVQISIARQINTSRAQRKLLEPLRQPSKMAMAKPTIIANDNPSAGPIKRVAETNTATPTVIHRAASLDKILRNSERVVLEEL